MKNKQVINKKDFENKTIHKIDTTCVNCIVFHFTDGTKTALEVELFNSTLGLYGIVQTDYWVE